MSLNTTVLNSAETQPIISRREQINTTLQQSCIWMVHKMATMIDETCIDKINQVASKTNGRIPKELKFKLFNVENMLKEYVGLITFDGEKKVYNQNVLPFTTQKGSGVPGFSWNTIFTREFSKKKEVTDIAGNTVPVNIRSNSRFRSAGINTFLAQDVKRTLNPRGIKVIDVSDSSKSKKIVYQITIFPFEENFKMHHGNTPSPVVLPIEVATFAFGHKTQNETPKKTTQPEAPDAPIKAKPKEDGIWLKALKGTLESETSETVKNLNKEFDADTSD